jgi:metal-responsive CopG/Arc/MetJ family transcriptional regulator
MKDDLEMVSMRLPTQLLRELDKFAEKKKADTGVAYTRTDAVRHLLTAALKKEGRDGKQK